MGGGPGGQDCEAGDAAGEEVILEASMQASRQDHALKRDSANQE